MRKRYGSDTVKQLRKFEKLDYKVCKNQGDLEFLKLCQENGLTSKFLNFKLANRNLRYSYSYKQCQSLLLKEEIKNKVSILARQKKEFDKVKSAFWLGMTPSFVILGTYITRNFIIWDYRTDTNVMT